MQRAASFKVIPLVVGGDGPHGITDKGQGRSPSHFRPRLSTLGSLPLQSDSVGWDEAVQPASQLIFPLLSTGVVHRCSITNILHTIPSQKLLSRQSNPQQWPFYCCFSVAQLSPPLCDPMGCSRSGLSDPHHLPKFAQVHVHCISDALFFYPHSFPASGTFPMSQRFTSDDQNTGVSASAPVLPMSIQGWFPLRSTGLMILLSKDS